MLPGILFLPEMPISHSLNTRNSVLWGIQFSQSILTRDTISHVYSLTTVLFLAGMPFSLYTVHLQFYFYLGCHFLCLQFTYSSVFTWDAIFTYSSVLTWDAFFAYSSVFTWGAIFTKFSFYLGCHSLSTVYLQFCFYLGCHFHLQFCFYLGCHFHQ